MSLADGERLESWSRRGSLLRWGACLLLVLALHAALGLTILLHHPVLVSVPVRPIETPVYVDLPPLAHSHSSPPRVPGLASLSQQASRPAPPPAPPLPPQPRPQATPLPLPPSPTEPEVALPQAKLAAPSTDQPKMSAVTPPSLTTPEIKRPTPAKPKPKPRPAETKPQPKLRPAKPRPQLAGIRPLTLGKGQPQTQEMNPAGVWMAESESYLRKFQRFQFYEGEVVVSIVIDRRGRILAKQITVSSGNGTLDGEAMKMLERAQTLPPPPAEVPGDTIPLTVQVYF